MPAEGQEDITVAVDSTNLLFTIDLQAPETKALYEYWTSYYLEVDEADYYNNPKIKFECSDPELGPPDEFGCKETKYCTGVADCSPDIDYTNPLKMFDSEQTGNYKLCYNSEDNGGNVETTKCKLIHIDKTKPSITISTPSDNYVTNQGTITVSGSWQDVSGIDNIKIEWYNATERNIVEASAGLGTFSASVDLFFGKNTIKAIAEDNAKPSKNKNETLITVYYDLIGPEITNAKIYNSTNRIDSDCIVDCFDGEYGNNITLNVSVTDSRWTNNIAFVNVTIECLSALCSSYGDKTYSMKNITKENYSITIDSTAESLGIGNYSATYYTEDALGNPSNYSLNFTIDDTTKPGIGISYPFQKDVFCGDNIKVNGSYDEPNLNTIEIIVVSNDFS